MVKNGGGGGGVEVPGREDMSSEERMGEQKTEKKGRVSRPKKR